jgi:hypothetical protein
VSPTSITPADGGDDRDAAAALGEAWEILDVLPRARAPVPLAATTLEMVAAEVEPAPSRDAGSTRRPRPWLGPIAAVVASLLAGFAAGRLTLPAADRFLIDNLPLVRHLDLLRELDSVEFLADIARTRPAPPRRLLFATGRVDLQEEQRRYTKQVAALRAAGPWGEAGRASLADRREELGRLGPDERGRLRDAAGEFADLPPADRRRLEEVAAAIVDPGRDDLREAGRLWRLWIAASDPLDRDAIIASDAAQRQAWMKRQARTEWPGPPRPRDPNADGRRPPGGGRFPDGPEPGRPGPDGPPPGGPDADRPFADDPPALRRPRRGDRPRPPEGPDLRRRPPLSPDRPDPAGPPPADAGETPAAPD